MRRNIRNTRWQGCRSWSRVEKVARQGEGAKVNGRASCSSAMPQESGRQEDAKQGGRWRCTAGSHKSARQEAAKQGGR